MTGVGMDSETKLREKLRKIEALFAGAGTPGERTAAEAAGERIRAKIRQAETSAPPVEMQYSLGNSWSRRLFAALCRRYGLKPYRYHRQRYTTVMLRVPRAFADTILWPEFLELDAALTQYLDEATDRIIREEVYHEATEAEEVDEPLRLGN